ncbi:MAG: C1 family peptidase [Verrucomicrobiia bacterium]
MAVTPVSRGFIFEVRRAGCVLGSVGLAFFGAETASAWDPLTRSARTLFNVENEEAPATTSQKPAAWDIQAAWNLLPRSVDLRPEMEALRVNFIQQGEKNTCAFFSASAALELRLRRLGVDLDISEQFMISAASREEMDVNHGVTTSELALILGKHGFCREEFMPYQAKGKETPTAPRHALDDAASMPLVYVRPISRPKSKVGLNEEDLLAICRVLARGSPVCFSSLWPGGEVKLTRERMIADEGVNARANSGHMVVLTGFVLPSGDSWENGFFHLRNSWGLGWGDFGFAKMPFGYAKRYGFEAVELRFDHDRKTGQGTSDGFEAPPAPPQASEAYVAAAQAWPLAPAKILALGLGAFVVGLIPPTLLLAERRKNLWGLLGTALLFLALYVLALKASFHPELTGGEWGVWKLGLLLIGLILCLTILARRMHGLSTAKSVLFVALWFGSFNLGLWTIPLMIKTPTEEVWLRFLLTRTMGDEEVKELFRSESDMALVLERALEVNPDHHKEATGWEQESDWLKIWAEDLGLERAMLKRQQKDEGPFFHARLASLRETHTRLKALQKDPQSFRQTASGDTNHRRLELEKAYWELEQARAKVDLKDAEAVRAFNEKAAEFRRMRAEFLEANKSATAPTRNAPQ